MTKTEAGYIIEPTGTVSASVIWLHGLGADGNDFVGIIDQLGLPKDHGVRFIFPNAPFRNVTINNGMRMRAWYDIFDLSMFIKEDIAGIKDSQQTITNIIEQQVAAGISADKIILAGFSQGGALALYAGLRYTKPLAGIIALSTYLPLTLTFSAKEFASNRKTPIFMAHGLFDTVVLYAAGQASYQHLQREGLNISWHSYPIMHSVSMDEIEGIGRFLRECLAYA